MLISPAVKTLRVVLLLLVAMLLPLRGAVAASMACGPAGGHAAVQSASMHHGAAHASHGAHGHHGSADAAASHAGHPHAEHLLHDAPGDDGQAAERCLLCAACGSAQPMPASVLAVPTPPPQIAAAFPAPSTPPLSFLSDGQERPPRSI